MAGHDLGDPPASHVEMATPQEEYSAFRLERRGIELIPEDEKKSTPRAVATLWSGALCNVAYVVYGALVISLGLSFTQAVIAIVLGNLTWVLLGLASLQGPETGTTTFVISRAPFGRNGNRSVSLFNWLTQVGFESADLALIVFAALVLLGKAGWQLNTPEKVGLIIVVAACQTVMPTLGHATISKLLHYLLYPFIALFVVMAILAGSKISAAHFGSPAPLGTFFAGLAVSISVCGLSWAEVGNDYSRYLPRRTPRKTTFWAVTIGTFIPSILLMTLGAAVFTITSKATDPISGLPAAFSSWFLVPYLIVAILQLFSINSLDLYSSGLTLQALGVPVKRYGAVLIDTGVCLILTSFVVFSNSFNRILSDFLLFTIVWLAPWCGIFLVDWLLRRGRYSLNDLVEPRGGLYWRNGGVHWPAIIALALGICASLLWLNAYPVYVSALSNATGGADFSAAMGFFAAAIAYFILARQGVRREMSKTPDATPSGASALRPTDG